MTQELQLRTGPYKTTFVGTEIIRQSTLDEWRKYGEILKRVDEAKQWAIGDWLCDGKRHYGDGLYQEAEKILGINENQLRHYKSLSSTFELCLRKHNLLWSHHKEVASLKTIEKDDKGKLYPSGNEDKEKMQEFLKKAEKEKWSIREMRVNIEKYKQSQQKKIQLANEPEKFSVIYADPPWQFDNSGFFESAEQQYNTMNIQELCDLPVKERIAKKAVLFLWITNAFLKEGVQLCEAWGFEYKTNLVWIKNTGPSLGWFTKSRHEILLIATRGEGTHPKEKFISWFQAEVSEHSKKPDKTYEIIERMYEGPYLELFAREKRKGWDSWGDELNGDS